jgi:hypothetical protein
LVDIAVEVGEVVAVTGVEVGVGVVWELVWIVVVTGVEVVVAVVWELVWIVLFVETSTSDSKFVEYRH